MKQSRKIVAMALSALVFTACQKGVNQPNEESADYTASSLNSLSREQRVIGHVYTLSNQVGDNQVLEYSKNIDGTLSFEQAWSTGGAGTGSGLGNQGAVALSDGNILLAVNAGSNSISSFRITENGLSLQSTVNSGGITPVSITQNDGIAFVLNAGGDGNIAGFTIGGDGSLNPIPGSERPLSATAAGAAQIQFLHDGRVLVITEKATNTITTYTVNASGIPGTMHTIGSSTPTPFGFASSNNGFIYVSEAAGGAAGASVVSSYFVSADGVISLVDGSVSAGQTAACWVAITANGKYVYASNTGSNSVSAFNANAAGDLSVLGAAAGNTGAGPTDAALCNSSKFLYVLNAGDDTIDGFAVQNDGSLSHIQHIVGIPNGTTGMVAR